MLSILVVINNNTTTTQCRNKPILCGMNLLNHNSSLNTNSKLVVSTIKRQTMTKLIAKTVAGWVLY